jgi:Na+/proline symporter
MLPKKTRNCHCCCHRIHLKIGLLLIIGIYVTYFVFDGFDIYVKAALLDNFDKKNTIGGLAQAWTGFFLCVLSMFIFLLPRQFHTAIVENNRKQNTMAFPIVFITFNIFVFPIAWGGNILLKERSECRYLFPINPNFLTITPWPF